MQETLGNRDQKARKRGTKKKKDKRDQKTQGKRGPKDWDIRVEGGGGKRA